MRISQSTKRVLKCGVHVGIANSDDEQLSPAVEKRSAGTNQHIGAFVIDSSPGLPLITAAPFSFVLHVAQVRSYRSEFPRLLPPPAHPFSVFLLSYLTFQMWDCVSCHCQDWHLRQPCDSERIITVIVQPLLREEMLYTLHTRQLSSNNVLLHSSQTERAHSTVARGGPHEGSN